MTTPRRSPTPFINNATYDVLKFMAQILLPAAGALYFGLAQIWGLPKAEEVVGTIVVVDTFLGVLLGLSSAQYNKSDAKYDGEIVVTQNFSPEEPMGGPKKFSIELNGDPNDIDNQDEVIFRIVRK